MGDKYRVFVVADTFYGVSAFGVSKKDGKEIMSLMNELWKLNDEKEKIIAGIWDGTYKEKRDEFSKDMDAVTQEITKRLNVVEAMLDYGFSKKEAEEFVAGSYNGKSYETMKFEEREEYAASRNYTRREGVKIDADKLIENTYGRENYENIGKDLELEKRIVREINCGKLFKRKEIDGAKLEQKEEEKKEEQQPKKEERPPKQKAPRRKSILPEKMIDKNALGDQYAFNAFRYESPVPKIPTKGEDKKKNKQFQA
jgi:hypothetical protein